jgi:hypothetical protein
VKNKALQFIVGCFVIYLTWQLHSQGWFAAAASLLSTGEYNYNGFSGSVMDLALSLLPLVVDAVATVGIVALAFFTFVWRVIKPLAIKLAILLDKKLEGYGIDLYELEQSTQAPPRKLDLSELENVLGRILDRVQRLEDNNES